MECSIDVKIRPIKNTIRPMSIGIEFSYLCPISKLVEKIIIYKKAGEDIQMFIQRIRDMITDGSLQYDITQKVKSAFKVGNAVKENTDDFTELKKAFQQLTNISVNVKIEE